MTAMEPVRDTDVIARRYVLGLVVLLVTVFLTNSFGFLDHPERVFDVGRNSALTERLHVIGFVGQLVTGLWLGFALIFQARGARAGLMAWALCVTLFFAPMPSGRDDWWLLPLLTTIAVLFAALGRAIDDALSPHAA